MQTSVLNAQGRHLIIPEEFSNFPFYRRAVSLSTFTKGFSSRKQKTTSSIFVTRTYRDRKEQEEEAFVLFLSRPFKLRIEVSV